MDSQKVMDLSDGSRIMKVIKVIGAPVIYCWRVSATRAEELPCPKVMRVVITAMSSILSYFLIYAFIKGVVSCF